MNTSAKFSGFQGIHNLQQRGVQQVCIPQKESVDTGKLDVDYRYAEMMELGRLTDNNLVDNGMWKGKGEALSQQLMIVDDPNNYIALATHIMENPNGQSRKGEDGKTSVATQPKDAKKTEGGPRTYLPWRFDNPGNTKTKEVCGTTMKWCTNNCHEKAMWCGWRM